MRIIIIRYNSFPKKRQSFIKYLFQWEEHLNIAKLRN